jgi:hypothetical protein
MKHALKTTKLTGAILVIVVFALLQTSSFAVVETARSRSIRIRKEVEKNRVDGLVIGVHQIENINEKNPPLVSPTAVFKDGDHVRISIESNFDGYVYVVNIEPNGDKNLSFPSRDTEYNNNRVTPGATVWIPPQDPLTFFGTKGIETLQVIVSKEPIAYYEEGYKTWRDGRIPETENERSRSWSERGRGVIVRDKVTIPAPMKGKILARKIDLAPPDKSSKEAVIAIPKDKNSNGKMNEQPVIFEIRLQHN